MSFTVAGPKGSLGFLHFPKCAGTWVRSICIASGLRVEESTVADGYSRHYGPLAWEGPLPDVSFTVVRHPSEWLVSWWRYNHPDWPQHELGRRHPCRFLDEIGAARGDWCQFSVAVTEFQTPGINAMFADLTGGVSSIWRFESLGRMLDEMEEILGERLDRSGGNRNESKTPLPEWDAEPRRRFEALVQPAIQIYHQARF